MNTLLHATGVALLCAGIMTGCSDTSVPSSPSATSIPLTVSRSAGATHAAINVTVAGTPVSLLFDTGSAGLMLFADSAPPVLENAAGIPFEQAFAGGVTLSGVETAASVTIAGVSTPGPIQIRLVQSASCLPQAPSCPAAEGIAGLARSLGVDGIFGAGFWAVGAVYSPLVQLDRPAPAAISVAWQGDAGHVELRDEAPGAQTLRMPAAPPGQLPNGVPAWNNQAVVVCWQIAAAARTCIPTTFDTGAAATSFPVGFPGASDTDIRRLPSGQTITATAEGSTEVLLSFETGRRLARDLVTVIPNATSANTGIGLFAAYEVVFTLADGGISFEPQ